MHIGHSLGSGSPGLYSGMVDDVNTEDEDETVHAMASRA